MLYVRVRFTDKTELYWGSPDGSRDPRSRAERLENWELQAAETIRRERKRNEAQHLVVVQLARARILGL